MQQKLKSREIRDFSGFHCTELSASCQKSITIKGCLLMNHYNYEPPIAKKRKLHLVLKGFV